jgi:hypothetical protein
VIFAWKWEMVLGGGGALLSLVFKPRATPKWPDLADLLHIEGICCLIASFGVSTYAYGTVSEVGLHNSVGALAFFIPIVLGHLYRGGQAIRQGASLQALAETLYDLNPREHASFTETEMEEDNGGGR